MRDVPQAPQTDPLDEARRQFKRWRNRRPHSRSRIPEELWTLAVQAARPRQNMIRYHGIFAANANRRPELQLLMPQRSGALAPSIGKGKKPAASRYRIRWLDLLERVLDLIFNYTRYRVCGGKGPCHPPVPSTLGPAVHSDRRTVRQTR